ncbi:unnamed protein product [Medioppia subpectinata]|uniref:Carboxylesterase type B domain-containing protein n=1 Tax=Medioppia subpectinata TaxID=1979941 RepID=A0A7R9KNR1_9ACAR|nr:unnamed protein product [Medioppia subpectinata]CAG2106934.1 unnamed protein product [Medioppia subpectinata]
MIRYWERMRYQSCKKNIHVFYNNNCNNVVVRGQTVRVLDASVDQFLGIPYAEPPIGALRVSSMGQNRANPDHKVGRYLKPVMFWIHGRGLSTGSIDKFNGGPLASQA